MCYLLLTILIIATPIEYLYRLWSQAKYVFAGWPWIHLEIELLPWRSQSLGGTPEFGDALATSWGDQKLDSVKQSLLLQMLNNMAEVPEDGSPGISAIRVCFSLHHIRVLCLTASVWRLEIYVEGAGTCREHRLEPSSRWEMCTGHKDEFAEKQHEAFHSIQFSNKNTFMAMLTNN